MANYTKITNFAAKDALASGNANKVVKGTEINTEFDNIATAVATKADLTSPTLVTPALGTPTSGVMTNVTGLPLTTGVTGTLPIANGGTGASTLASASIVTYTGTETLTNKTLTTPVISTISNTGTLTLPTSTDTLVGRATTDTLTNKTLTSPTLTTPALGTPSSLVLTNATGLPQAGLGTNVVGNGPAFSAYATATQSISNATATKVVYDTEDFDTNSNFASNRFTPTVAGYYQINAGLFCAGSATGGNILSLYKNGSEYVQLTRTLLSNAFNVFSNGSCLVYCNGSTDYLEIFTTQNSGGTLSLGNGTKAGCWFNGALVRSA